MTSGRGSHDLPERGDFGPKRLGPARAPEVRIDPRSFYGTLPRQLLSRLLDGDPLDLELRCERRRDELAYLMSRDRLLVKSAARCAHAGFSYRGEPPVKQWITDCIDLAVRDILTEDESAVRKNLPVERPTFYEMLSEAVGFTPTVSRAAHVAFNELDTGPRAAYFALSVQGRTLEEYTAAGGGSPETIRRDLSKALETLIGFLPSSREGDGR